MSAPANWEVRPLGELLQVRYGKALPAAQRDPEGTYPVVGSAGRMTFTSEPLVAAPVVVVGRKGNVGDVILEHDGCWPIDTTYFFEVPPLLDATFLLHQLRWLELRKLDSSTATPSLRRQDLEAQTLLIPSLGEQRRIVEILEDHLSRLDAATELTTSSVSRARALEERLILDGLTGRSVRGARAEARPPAADCNDGSLPALPASWRWSRLDDVADVVGGVTKDSKKQTDLGNVEVPYLRVANVQRGRLDLTTVTTIRVPPAKAAALTLLPGDVLLNEGGDRDKLARGWVWEGQIENCIHQNHVFRARVRDNIVDPRFLSWTANTIGGRWAERNGKQSVNLASISLSMIRKMPVIVPPSHVSTAVAEDLEQRRDAFDRLTQQMEEAMTRAATLRRAILAAAFSGRLTGHRTDDEVIEELAQ